MLYWEYYFPLVLFPSLVSIRKMVHVTLLTKLFT